MTERYSGFGSGHSGDNEQQIQPLIEKIYQLINSPNESEQTVNQEEPIQIPESSVEKLEGLREKIRNLLENMVNILTDFNFGFEAKLVLIEPILPELADILNRLLSDLRELLGPEYIEKNSVQLEEMLLVGNLNHPEQWHPLIRHLFQELANADKKGGTNTSLGVTSGMELLKENPKKTGSYPTGIIDPERLAVYRDMIAAITCLIHMGQGSQIPKFEAQLERANSIEDILTLITQIEEIIIFLSAIKEYSTNGASINLISYIIGNYSKILQQAKKLKNTEQGQLAETNSLESFNRLVKELENRFKALVSSLTKYSEQANNRTIPYSFFLKILDRILQTYEEPLIELMQQIRDRYREIATVSRVDQDLKKSYLQTLRICDQITSLLYGEKGMLTLIKNRISEAYSLLKKDSNNANLSLQITTNLIQEIEKRLPRLTSLSEDRDLISQIGRLIQEYINMLDSLKVAKNRLNKLEST